MKNNVNYKKDLIEAAQTKLREFRKVAGPVKLSSPIKKLSLESLEWLVNELDDNLERVEFKTGWDEVNKTFIIVSYFKICVKERKTKANLKSFIPPDVRIIIDPPEDWL